jgi:hypothetical protein
MNARPETLSESIQCAINAGLLLLSTTNQLATQLLNGNDKVIVIEWNGDIRRIHEDRFNPERGDGRVTITYPGQVSYQVPPSVDPDDAAFNIRMAVPLWLLNTNSRYPVVLGLGVFHPIYTSAQMVMYEPMTRRKVGSYYMGDPRVPFNQPLPEGHLHHREQGQILREAGCCMEPTPLLAPQFSVPWYGIDSNV